MKRMPAESKKKMEAAEDDSGDEVVMEVRKRTKGEKDDERDMEWVKSKKIETLRCWKM